MKFTVEHIDNLVIFTLKDKKINSELSSELKTQFLILSQPDIAALVLDLSAVDYIDSSGLGALLLSHRQLKEYDIPVILVGLQDMITKLLKISYIDHLFKYSNTVEEVINNYKKREI